MTGIRDFRGWGVAAVVGDRPCGFTAIDWLRAESQASGDAVASNATLAVEVWKALGGKNHSALLAARFDPSAEGVVQFDVGHTGKWELGESRSCQGLLGKPLAPALPLEVARGAIAGLVGCDAPLPPGRLSVVGGGYHEVDSSFYSFECAGWLLRTLLPAALARKELTDEVLYEAFQRCEPMNRY